MGLKIVEILPELCDEIRKSLVSLGRQDIIDQLDELRLKNWTHDSEVEAINIYLSGGRQLNVVEQNIITVKYGESISLGDCEGIVVLDTDNFGRVMGIELIGRPDIWKKLSKYPSAPMP